MADTDSTPPLCACGCGGAVRLVRRRWNTYILGHHRQSIPTGSASSCCGGVIVGFKGRVQVYQPSHPRAIGGYVFRAWLVAEAKIGRPLRPGEIVHHDNRDPSDDSPENLIVLPSRAAHIAEHRQEVPRGTAHWNAKLTAAHVAEIRAARGIVSQTELAERFGVSPSLICKISRGNGWRG